MNNQATLSRTIQVQMVRRGLTQARMAQEVGISETSLSRYVNNRHPWTVPLLDAIAKPLGLRDAFGLVDAARQEQHLAA